MNDELLICDKSCSNYRFSVKQCAPQTNSLRLDSLQTQHNQTLENVQSAKNLCITITDNMDWGHHDSEISSKATKTLGFLRRNLAFAPTPRTKEY